MRLYDEDNVYYQQLHNNFINEYENEKDKVKLADIVKHSNTYSLYCIARYIQNLKKELIEIQKKHGENDEIKKEIKNIDKMQQKVTTEFLKKWLEMCPDRRIIFDFIDLANYDEKQQRQFNETISKIHSVGYIQHFIETVKFADKEFIENAIRNGTDYCLKYEYGIHNPAARRSMVIAMRKQAEKQKMYAPLIKQYAKELADMKSEPSPEPPKML